MTHIEKLFKHSSHYLAGQFVLLLTGLLSFPILTRVFTVSEYGTLSLISSVLLFSTALSKLGLQHSAVRFYDEFKSGKRREPISRFYSTIFLGPLMCSVIMILLVLTVTALVSDRRSSSNLGGLMPLVAILIPVQCAQSTFTELLRGAENKTLQRFHHSTASVAGCRQSVLRSRLFQKPVRFVPGADGRRSNSFLRDCGHAVQEALISFAHFFARVSKRSGKIRFPAASARVWRRPAH